MTAEERLVFLSGTTGLTAGEHLRRIALRWGNLAAGTASALLVAFSGLPSATAAQHLLHDPAEVVATVSNIFGGPDASLYDEVLAKRRAHAQFIRRQNDLIIMTVIAAVTGGMLE